VRKRSKYRPRLVLKDPMNFVLSGMQPLPQLKEQYLSIQLKHRAALEQVRTGNATRDDIDKLIGMVNMSEALALLGHGKEWLEQINQAQSRLYELAQRGAQQGMHFVMKAPEWEALKELAQVHEAQLESSTVIDIERAYDLVQKTLRTGTARKILVKES